jgi:membrane protease YdiL (CAAX protease family)
MMSATTTSTSTRSGARARTVMPFGSSRARATPPRPHARVRTRDDVVVVRAAIRCARRWSTRCRAERGDGDDDGGVETKDEERLSVVARAPSRASIDAVRARARVSPASATPAAPALLDDYRERWDVPWGGGTVALGLFGWCVSFVGVAAVVFPLAMAEAGIDPTKMTTGEQAEYLLAVQLAETATSLGLVYALVSRHTDVVRDETKDWFKIDFSEPFERERGWAKYGLLGYGATFFALAATGLVVDALESGAQTVDKASEQVGTIDGVMPLIQSDDPGTFVAVLAVTSVFAPLLEEVVFRGFLLASLTKWLPTPGAVLFSSVLFALAHLAPRDFVELVVLGMVLGFSYARTRNLLTPMLIHSLWNSGVLVVVAVAIKAGVASELGIPGF